MHRLQLLLLHCIFLLLLLMVLEVGWKNLFDTIFVDVNYLVVWLCLMRYIRFKIYYFFLLRLALADHHRHVLFGFLVFLEGITISQVLPITSVLLTLVSILLLNSPVNNEPSFLKLLDPPHKIFILKVTPRYRILVRSFGDLWVVLAVPAFVVIITVVFFVVDELFKAINTGLNQIVQHVDANKICHFGIHFFPLKKLESKVTIFFGTWIRVILYHVIKVELPLTHPGRQHHNLRWLGFFSRSADLLGVELVRLLCLQVVLLRLLYGRLLLLNNILLMLQYLCHFRVRKKLLYLLLRHLLQDRWEIKLWGEVFLVVHCPVVAGFMVWVVLVGVKLLLLILKKVVLDIFLCLELVFVVKAAWELEFWLFLLQSQQRHLWITLLRWLTMLGVESILVLGKSGLRRVKHKLWNSLLLEFWFSRLTLCSPLVVLACVHFKCCCR